MSRVEYCWQVALQQRLLPLPRLPQSIKNVMFELSAIHRPVLTYLGTVQGEPILPDTRYRLVEVIADKIGPQGEKKESSRSRETLSASAVGKSPFFLDIYLSSMSPVHAQLTREEAEFLTSQIAMSMRVSSFAKKKKPAAI